MSETSLPTRPFLNRFRVVRFLGRGGMAMVYLGQEPGSSEQVVIKVMQDRFAADPKCREAFRREMDFMSQFRHPHAVALHDASLDDPQGPCIVMEYLPGIALDDLLLKEKRLTPQRVGQMLGPLCMMLQAMHDQKFIHRDLKTGNIMVLNAGTRNESVKVLDFGLARKIQAQAAGAYIPLEKIRQYTEGTPAYMSPEQLSNGPMDQRGDIYSMGVILYELLTGHRPFEDDDIVKLLEAQADQPPPPMGTGNGVNVKIETLIRECLSKKPEKRPKSARDLAMRYEDASGCKVWYEEIHKSMLPAGAPAGQADEPEQPAAKAVNPRRDDTVYELEAWMPESIAVMKMGGFLNDIGGEVTESVPGMVRVYLKRPRAAKSSEPAAAGGFLSWFGKTKKSDAQDVEMIEMEVHMAPHASGRSNHLHITLLLRMPTGQRPPDWKPWCDKTVGDLAGYLMAKKM